MNVPSPLDLLLIAVIGTLGIALCGELLRNRRLSRQLSECAQEASLAADAANVGIWTRDIVRDTISASTHWRQLFGFASDEHLDTESLLQRVHVDDRAAFRERVVHATQEWDSARNEFRLSLPDGRRRWITVVGNVELDARGKALRSRGACIDITARKQAELEALRLRHDFVHAGRVLVMGQLSWSLAHEISQPLGAILRNAEAAALFLQQPSPDLDEIAAIVQDIRKDDQRACEVIERMRALLRHEAAAMTPLDVQQVLSDATALLRSDAAARRVALALDVSAGLRPIRGDGVQIQQVLLNLMLNAMDALEDRDSSGRSIVVTAHCAGEASVEISVCDSGCGIAADQLARIFEPFFTTKTKGLGVGLSLSRSIVEAHGGRLWAENNALAGATFRFTLPTAA